MKNTLKSIYLIINLVMILNNFGKSDITYNLSFKLFEKSNKKT